MGRTAIIAGKGELPKLLASKLSDPVYVTFEKSETPINAEPLLARIEKLGQLFKDLKSKNVSSVSFAGSMSRPKINPLKLDRHALRLAMSLGKGDDGLLREVINLFTEQGFQIHSANEICPELTLQKNTHWGAKVTEQDSQDIAKAQDVLAALSPMDVAQGVVCAGGQVLGIETIQGTDALLDFVARTPDNLRRSQGVFVKMPKAGQDMRIDIPTIGPDTIDKLIEAGIGGIAIPAGEVLILQSETVRQKIEKAGLFLRVL